MTASHPPAIPDPRTDDVWDGPEPKEHRTVIEQAQDGFVRIYDKEQDEDDGPVCAWIEGEAYEL